MERGPMVLFVVAALLAGATVGILADRLVLRPSVDAASAAVVVPTGPAEDELLARCSELFPSERARLAQVQSDVLVLQAALAAKEQELAAVQAEAGKERDAAVNAAARAKKLQDEIGRIRTELAEVTAERDRLVAELTETLDSLEAAVERAGRAEATVATLRAEAVRASWEAFVASAKVAICDRGTSKRHEKCHQAVQTALGPRFRSRYEACVGTGQATPVLGRLEPKAKLPAAAELLADDKAYPSKGWYVLFCDPTLPEAADPRRAVPAGTAL